METRTTLLNFKPATLHMLPLLEFLSPVNFLSLMLLNFFLIISVMYSKRATPVTYKQCHSEELKQELCK
jgi:hypothetical protein